MKRTLAVAVAALLLCGAVFAADPDPISDARVHAQMDAGAYKPTGWGFLAFGASALISPLLGGGAVIVAANVIDPDVEIPTARLAYAQEAYPSSNDMLLYQSQYREEMARPMQKSRSKRAWIGTGIGFGINLLVVYALLSAY